MDIIVKSTLQETPKVVVTYSYMECWIKSYKGPDLDGSADALAIESIVICAEDILIKPGS
jgi:hypothetical protein